MLRQILMYDLERFIYDPHSGITFWEDEIPLLSYVFYCIS